MSPSTVIVCCFPFTIHRLTFGKCEINTFTVALSCFPCSMADGWLFWTAFELEHLILENFLKQILYGMWPGMAILKYCSLYHSKGSYLCLTFITQIPIHQPQNTTISFRILFSMSNVKPLCRSSSGIDERGWNDISFF